MTRASRAAVRTAPWLGAFLLGLPGVAEARDAGVDRFVVVEGRTVARLGRGSAKRRLVLDVPARRLFRVEPREIVGLDLEGHEIWRQPMEADASAALGGVFTDAAGTVIVRLPSMLHAFDKRTGALRFRRGIGPAHRIEPVGARLLTFPPSGEPVVEAIDPTTGTLLWSARFPVRGERTHVSDVVHGAVRLWPAWLWHPLDPATGKAPSFAVAPGPHPALRFDGTFAFHAAGGGAGLAAHDRDTGALLWSVPEASGADRILGPPAHGRLHLASATELVAVDLEQRCVLFRVPFTGAAQADRVAVQRETVAVLDADGLRVHDATTGALRFGKPAPVGGQVFAGPEGTLLFLASGRDDGAGLRLVCLHARTGETRWAWPVPRFKDTWRHFGDVEVVVDGPRIHVGLRWAVTE